MRFSCFIKVYSGLQFRKVELMGVHVQIDVFSLYNVVMTEFSILTSDLF